MKGHFFAVLEPIQNIFIRYTLCDVWTIILPKCSGIFRSHIILSFQYFISKFMEMVNIAIKYVFCMRIPTPSSQSCVEMLYKCQHIGTKFPPPVTSNIKPVPSVTNIGGTIQRPLFHDSCFCFVTC